MNFISLTFVFSFPVVVLLYWKIPWKYRELFLLAVSYFFYIKRKFLGREDCFCLQRQSRIWRELLLRRADTEEPG